MYPVSNNFKTAVNAPQRYFTCEVKIYLDGEDQPPLILGDTEISSFSVLEDMTGSSYQPLSFIGSNELSLSINNEGGLFTPHNESSPYYGKLVPEILVEVFLKLEVMEDVFETVPMGKYWTGEWKAPYSTLSTSVTCYDRLYKIKQLPIPLLPIFYKKTLRDVVKAVFTALGMVENVDYVLEAPLSQQISLGWVDGNTMIDVLETITVAGACVIGMDKQGKVFVRSSYQFMESGVAFSGHEQVIAPETELNYLKSYTKAEVLFKIPSIRTSITEVLSISSLTINPGRNEFAGIKFSSTPVAAVTSIAVTGGKGVTIESAETGTKFLSIVIISTHNNVQEVKLEAYGHLFARADTDVAFPATAMDKMIVVDNSLIQSRQVAMEYKAVLQNYLDTPTTQINTEIRGNPAVELFDVVSYQNPYDYLPEKEIVPTRFVYTYDGALTCSMLAITKDSLTVHDWVFMSPGLYTRVVRGGI